MYIPFLLHHSFRYWGFQCQTLTMVYIGYFPSFLMVTCMSVQWNININDTTNRWRIGNEKHNDLNFFGHKDNKYPKWMAVTVSIELPWRWGRPSSSTTEGRRRCLLVKCVCREDSREAEGVTGPKRTVLEYKSFIKQKRPAHWQTGPVWAKKFSIQPNYMCNLTTSPTQYTQSRCSSSPKLNLF